MEIDVAGIPPLDGFTGKERDVETGLDYFGARYYPDRKHFGRDPSDDGWRVEDPALRGRQWLSVDPMAEKYPGCRVVASRRFCESV